MLDQKKRRFVKAMLAGASQTQAAILAGYSEKSARQQGYLLAKDPEIKLEMNKKWLKEASKAENSSTFEGSCEVEELGGGINADFEDPMDFLKAVMNNKCADLDMRKDAAKALMPYLHTKKGEGGKKDQKQDAAKKAASRFATPQAPRLVANNGK